MSGTIRDNLLLADASASEEGMRSALHTAVADFVFDLPDGLDTVCGEAGGGLSEGQCQRIAIARALLHRGGNLLLDEFHLIPRPRDRDKASRQSSLLCPERTSLR